MSAYLVVIESPHKANTISKFLGKKYKVVASVGHLRDLPKSTMGVDIENDFTPKYLNIRGKADIIKDLKKEAKEADKIFLATDPDREGEAISWHLADILGINEKEVCRVTFNELTKNVVIEAFKRPRPIDKNLVDAYQARRVLDRVVGYSISPILWSKVKKGLSAGRVQSAVVKLICDREDEIDNFESQEYWSISALLAKMDESGKASRSKEFNAKFIGGMDGRKIPLDNEADANKILEDVKDKDFIVRSVKNSTKHKSPLPPFVTSTLQQEASRKLNFNTVKTMAVIQQLYEGVNVGAGDTFGLVTYIRTDSVRVSEEAANSAAEYIKNNYGKSYLPATKRIYKNKNAAQDAHEAIRPTHIDLTPESIRTKLTTDQYKLYKLVYERFIASQMADAVYDTCVVDISAGDYIFRANGEVQKFQGFTKVYGEIGSDSDEGDNKKLPSLSAGEKVQKLDIKPNQHFTQPPSRYTEGSLVKALEEYGIGRPSTYATVISTIQTRGYVGKEKKTLYPTELGRIVNELLMKSFPDIVDTEFTAQIEDQLDMVEQGDKQWVYLMKDFYKGFQLALDTAQKEIEHVKIPDPVSDVPCDKCGKMMVIKTGRFGKFLACPGYPECKNTKPFIVEVGVNCPSCGKPLIYRKTKTGKQYVACSAYPDCTFSSWNIPTGEKCPKCGSHLEYMLTKQKKRFVGCSNKECTYTASAYSSNNKKTEKDQDI